MTLSLRDPRSLDDLLNYRLFRLLAVSSAPVIRLLEGRWGIARREWRLIAVLAAQGAISPSALAERANLDRPRTSRAITILVAKRLVKRSGQAGDTRRATLVLTAAGQRLHAQVFPQIAAINAQVLSVLDDATVQAIDHALALLTAHAERLNGEIVQDAHADRRRGGVRRPASWESPDE